MKKDAKNAREKPVRIECTGVWLDGDLTLPRDPQGLVVFAHGSGSSRKSPRNRKVAARMCQCGLGTLLFDLLTPEEERAEEAGAMLRFDIPFLAGRLSDATDWLRRQPVAGGLGIGYFGSSTGAAAALLAAAQDAEIRAVVSRGGRTDLAGEAVSGVIAPVLLICGSEDPAVMQWSHETMERLTGVRRLAVVEGAGHLFEEPGTLDEAADIAADWFVTHLPKKAAVIS